MHSAHIRVEFIGSWGPEDKLCGICGIIFSTSGTAGQFWIFYCQVIAQQWQAAILWGYFNMDVILILVWAEILVQRETFPVPITGFYGEP